MNIKNDLITKMEWNIGWYRRKSKVNKYTYYLFNILVLSLPSLILFFNSNEEYSGFITPTIFANIIVTSCVMTFKPFQSWNKFKRAEIKLCKLRFNLDLDISRCDENKSKINDMLEQYSSQLENVLLEVASDYFSEFEKEKNIECKKKDVR